MSVTPEDLKPVLARLSLGERLSEGEAETAFRHIMNGAASEGQIGAFLMALRLRGETTEEIAAGAAVLRERMIPVKAPAGAIDCCGTGGDGKGSYNVSTAVSFVLAGLGLKVAKHGNRALSSKSGAADVLAALGVKLEMPAERIAKAIEEIGVGFMMAPLHHSAMRHVAPVRQALGFRTVFNLLGPLANPAGVRRQLVGVFSKEWTEPVAKVLQRLGSEKAWVVHGSDGLDELTTTGVSHVTELDGGRIRSFEVTPEDAGLPRARLADLTGGDAKLNAFALKALLAGEAGPYRDIVLLNAAACLVIAGRAESLKAGAAEAARAIDDGRAMRALERLIDFSEKAGA